MFCDIDRDLINSIEIYRDIDQNQFEINEISFLNIVVRLS